VSEPAQVASPPTKPLVVFDGDCNFCRRWIRRFSQITGDHVDYLPFQDSRIAGHFPELPRERFEQAVQLVATDGKVYGGADAICRALACRLRWPLWIYQHVPGIAATAERVYRLVAGHRMLFSRFTQLLWGDTFERPEHRRVRWLFLRLLGLSYLIAFASLGTQIDGLIGKNGIAPAGQFMRAVERAAEQPHLGVERYRLWPTLCWWRADDSVLHWQCGAGVVLSLLVIIGIAPAPCLFLLSAIYLSLATVCQVFLGYQWDYLLLETGFLAIFFAPLRPWPSLARESRPSLAVLWLLRWLLFRLMFGSGCVKLLSGDPTWHNLTALNYQYETQPLPTWIGWYAHQLPEWCQQASTALILLVELAVPLLIFLPRRLRLAAFWPFVALQLVIAATGNYCFFNLITIALCMLLLDDRALLGFIPRKWKEHFPVIAERPRPPARAGRYSVSALLELLRRGLVAAVAVVVLTISFLLMCGMFRMAVPWPAPAMKLYEWAGPFRSVNHYGLFAVMTTSRLEIIVEGSNDRLTWLAYEFKHKPGDLKRRPDFVAPHQPRLDWQMWFAALGDYRQNPWFINFCYRLLQGSPEVLSLLERNPFPEAPPKYIRALVYDYHFTDFAARRADGAWWRRELRGEYCPMLSLRDPGGRQDRQ